MSGFGAYMAAQTRTQLRRAEVEGAQARLELAQRDERAAMLVSQHEPVESLGIDRKKLAAVLSFLKHGDLRRLEADASEVNL